jgi:hypothetical protein
MSFSVPQVPILFPLNVSYSDVAAQNNEKPAASDSVPMRQQRGRSSSWYPFCRGVLLVLLLFCIGPVLTGAEYSSDAIGDGPGDGPFDHNNAETATPTVMAVATSSGTLGAFLQQSSAPWSHTILLPGGGILVQGEDLPPGIARTSDAVLDFLNKNSPLGVLGKVMWKRKNTHPPAHIGLPLTVKFLCRGNGEYDKADPPPAVGAKNTSKRNCRTGKCECNDAIITCAWSGTGWYAKVLKTEHSGHPDPRIWVPELSRPLELKKQSPGVTDVLNTIANAGGRLPRKDTIRLAELVLGGSISDDQADWLNRSLMLCFVLLCFALLCFALPCLALLCFALLCFDSIFLICFALPQSR